MTELSREDQKRMWSAIDFLTGLGRDGALAVIAMATHAERPEWPLVTIFDELGKDMRDLHEIAHAASTAARSTGPNRTKHPAGIRTTFPGSDDCSVCAQREKAQHAGPPPIEYCKNQKCRRMLETGVKHVCVDRDQGGMPAAARALIEAQAPHRAEIKQLRQALANNPEDPDFANTTHDRIAVLQATIQDLAAEVTA